MNACYQSDCDKELLWAMAYQGYEIDDFSTGSVQFEFVLCAHNNSFLLNRSQHSRGKFKRFSLRAVCQSRSGNFIPSL